MDGPQDLFDAAKAVREHAYVPYSGYRVGAALRTRAGLVHAGANVENAAYPLGVCAEAAAIAAMVAAGAHRIAEIVVLAEGTAMVTPCGGCRQRIIEFGGRDAVVWAAGPHGFQQRFTAGELLPFAFGPDAMAPLPRATQEPAVSHG